MNQKSSLREDPQFVSWVLTGNIVYIAYNVDKVLLGRFRVADALGSYSRAYYLIDVPTSNLNAAIGGVTFAALSPSTRPKPFEVLLPEGLFGYRLYDASDHNILRGVRARNYLDIIRTEME
jgi:Polysaccharide biosynthesis protein